MNPLEKQFLQTIKDNPKDNDTRMVYADWLEDHGREEEADAARSLVCWGRPKELSNDQGWDEVFKYADPKPALPNSKVDCSQFTRDDVQILLASVVGDNDGPDWVCCGKLWDGRWFSLSAWCDYTGWG